MNQDKDCEGRVLVTGAGGFIGHHMVNFLKKKGYWVRGVDIKRPEFNSTNANEFLMLDIRNERDAWVACSGIDQVYHFAADMGGIGYIKTHFYELMKNNSRININMLEACRIFDIKKLFFSSSACIYPEYYQDKSLKQYASKTYILKEEDALPAQPDSYYGWEKLYTEILCEAYSKDYELECRIARYHNIFGPEGAWIGGREKAPAALSRKIAKAKDGDSIIIWGDGSQSRTFLYIDDCLNATYMLMNSNYKNPLNIGSDEVVTINQLVDLISRIAKKKIQKQYDLTKPIGVKSRSADLTLVKKVLGWEKKFTLKEGLEKTYPWINQQVKRAN
ncbi:MAG: NAD-dependent epimerase/dehydratase family protein [Candidatus Hodarchaeales archaeon]|jgi:nucleoside-diphosphate-sugar epimerase